MRRLPESPIHVVPTSVAKLPARVPGPLLSGSSNQELIGVRGMKKISIRRNVSFRNVLQFSEQLVTLLEAGLSIDKALMTAAATVSSTELQRIIGGVVIQIEKGVPLSDALKAHPRSFPRLYVNMIKAGEEGGVLPVVLRRVNEYFARRMEFRSYVLTASIYPAILLVFGLAAVLGLVTFVVPKFAEVFASMDKPMPPTAAFLIAVAEGLRHHWEWLSAGLVMVWCDVVFVWSRPSGRQAMQTALLRTPVFGDFVLKLQFAQVARTLGTLLASGVPILTSLRIVQGVSGFLPVSSALQQTAIRIKDGQTVSAALAANTLYPRLLVQLCRVGEESGALDRMILKVADQFELDVQRSTKSFVAAFEPLMILFIGGLIGFVVISMLLAVFALNDMPI